MTRSGRVLLASGIAAMLGLTACSAGSSPPARGGGPPAPVTVTLTLGVPDSPGYPPEFQDIAYFARQVRQLSGGRMRIRICGRWRG
jgi:TRAP-type C4-dicarboxylate transport system substrate-binding protein